MNANPTTITTPAETQTAHKISGELLQEARSEAARVRRSMVEVLEEKLGLPPTVFSASLGLTLHYPVLSMEQMQQLRPAFDLLPFSLATQKKLHRFLC